MLRLETRKVGNETERSMEKTIIRWLGVMKGKTQTHNEK
jgi:hypothetical protein